tara:strand:+ start:306 stop:704 length:399 start_codon:yes stop_codon:yes gene_type:complete
MMASPRFVPTRSNDADTVPFATVEEAWMWGVKSLQCRLDGAQMRPGVGAISRPCEASDVVNCAERLRRRRELSATDISVLFLYGQYAIPPRALGRVHIQAARVWERALARLEPLLEQKGIITPSSARDADHA